MRKTLVRSMILVILSLLMMIVPGLAHEAREIGDYTISFGWRNEPAIQGQMNGPDFFIGLAEVADNQQEILEALDVSLQAEVSFGPESRIVDLRTAYPAYSVHGEHGYVNYIADLIPTMPGDYSFRIFGTIDGIEVDEVFSSSDGEFSTVEPSSDIMFPEAGIVDVNDLLARIEALEAQLEELQGE